MTWRARSRALAVLVALAFAACAAPTSPPPALSRAPASGESTPEAGAVPRSPVSFTAEISRPDAGCTGGVRCEEWRFAWVSDADPGTWFRVYRGYRSLMTFDKCAGARVTAKLLVESEPGARSVTSVTLVEPLAMPGVLCHWVSAVNGAGESDLVAVSEPTP
jgi:hypothetical protein